MLKKNTAGKNINKNKSTTVFARHATTTNQKETMAFVSSVCWSITDPLLTHKLSALTTNGQEPVHSWGLYKPKPKPYSVLHTWVGVLYKSIQSDEIISFKGGLCLVQCLFPMWVQPGVLLPKNAWPAFLLRTLAHSPQSDHTTDSLIKTPQQTGHCRPAHLQLPKALSSHTDQQ